MLWFKRKPAPVTVINAPNVLPVTLQKELLGQVEKGSVVEIRQAESKQWQITKRPDNEHYSELAHAVKINDDPKGTLIISAWVPGIDPVQVATMEVPPHTYLRGFLLSHKE